MGVFFIYRLRNLNGLVFLNLLFVIFEKVLVWFGFRFSFSIFVFLLKFSVFRLI